jgi:hypothetical protein
MAARITKRQATTVREAIKVGLLMKRLQDHTLGHVEMSQTQIAAARILLDRALPVLSAVTHSGEVEHQVKLSVTLTPHGR